MLASIIRKWSKLIDNQYMLITNNVIVLIMTTPEVVTTLELVLMRMTNEDRQVLKLL